MTHQMKKANAGLSVARESGIIICILTQRQAEEWQSLLLSGKKGKGFMYALIRGYCHGEAIGRITRSGASYMIV